MEPTRPTGQRARCARRWSPTAGSARANRRSAAAGSNGRRSAARGRRNASRPREFLRRTGAAMPSSWRPPKPREAGRRSIVPRRGAAGSGQGAPHRTGDSDVPVVAANPAAATIGPDSVGMGRSSQTASLDSSPRQRPAFPCAAAALVRPGPMLGNASAGAPARTIQEPRRGSSSPTGAPNSAASRRTIEPKPPNRSISLRADPAFSDEPGFPFDPCIGLSLMAILVTRCPMVSLGQLCSIA